MPLGKNADAGDYVRDFAKSKAPQFKGKSKKKRQQMAIAAYLDAKGPKESTMKTFDQIRSSLQEKKVDEISSNKLGNYMTKSAAAAAEPGASARTQDKRIAGQSMADKKIRKKMGYSSDAKVPAGINAGMNEAVAAVGKTSTGSNQNPRGHSSAAISHTKAAVKHMDQYKATGDSAHKKAADLHKKAADHHAGTSKVHKSTTIDGQVMRDRTRLANKMTAAANAASAQANESVQYNVQEAVYADKHSRYPSKGMKPGGYNKMPSKEFASIVKHIKDHEKSGKYKVNYSGHSRRGDRHENPDITLMHQREGDRASHYVVHPGGAAAKDPKLQHSSFKLADNESVEYNIQEAATDTGTIHVIHHPTKGYRQKGGGYSKEINRKTKTFKSHDTAAKSDNSALHYQHHDDPKTGKQHTSYHPSTNRGTRVHTIDRSTGKVTKGDYLHHHQATAAQKLAKKNNSSEFPTRAGKTHLDDIPKNKRFDHGTQKGHYVESVKSADKKPEKYVDSQGKTKIRMVPVDRDMGEDKAADRDALQKAMDVFKKRGGKITKVAPGKAAGYHGKDDPGKDMKGMMDKGDTKDMPKKKFVGSMK